MKFHRPNHRWYSVLLGTTALSILGADIASAQIDEIIVTARKREESLQNVPVSVSTLAGPQISNMGIKTPLDLGRYVPGLQSNVHPSSASIVTFQIRGQSAGDVLSTVDQAVGIYKDGVYIPRPRGQNSAFFDLDRVEVLKGPQGTLYGRNTTGGTINFISKGADYDGFHGFIQGEAGSEKLLVGGGAINVPIVEDKLAVRLAYQRYTRDGFGENVPTGQDIGQDRNQHFFRGTLLFDPFENVSVEIKGERYRSRENGNLYNFRGLTPGSPVPIVAAYQTPGACDATCLGNIFAGTPTAGDLAALGAANATLDSIAAMMPSHKTFNEFNQEDNYDTFGIGGTITIGLTDDIQLKSITGYREFTNTQWFDLDGTPFRILAVGMGAVPGANIMGLAPGGADAPFQHDPGPEQKAKFFSQEFNLSGTGWDGKLDWLGGVYYSNENGSDTQHAQALPPLVQNTFVHDGEEIQNTSWSVFSENTLDFSDWGAEGISLTFGGRYTEERKYLDSFSRNFYHSGGMDAFNMVAVAPNNITCLTGVLGVFPESDDGASCRTHNERTFTGFSYLGSLNYQLNDDILTYVKVAKSFRGGSFQLRSPTLEPASPETAREVEVGIKSDWFSKRLRVNLAGYMTKYGNKQESIIVTNPNTGGSETIIQNAASADLKGVEAELFANPVDGLTLRSSASYFSGKYDSFPGALPIQGGAPVDASGEKFAQGKWTYAVGGRYEREVCLGSLAGILGAQMDWTWQAGSDLPDRLRNPGIPDNLIQEFVATCSGSCSNGENDLGLLSAAIDYEIEDWGTTLTFFGTNLLDREWSVPGPDPANLGGMITAMVQEPRMWGFRIRKGFGGE